MSFEFDNIGGADTLDGSFAQAASVTAIAITGMILYNLFMFTLLRVDCPYHSCGNTANYCQRRNVMSYHVSRRDNCPIAYFILITILTQDKIIVKMVITPETLLTN